MSTSKAPAASSRGMRRRSQLVRHAIDLLCEGGLAGTSIGAVADRAGVSKGVVGYHFPSKDLLLAEVVTSLYTDAGKQIRSAADSQPGSVEAIVRYVETNLVFIEANARHVRAVMEIVASGTFRPDSVNGDPVLTHLVGLIEEGPFAHVHAPSLALIIRSSLDAAAARSVTGDLDIATFSSQLCAMVRRVLVDT